MRKQFPLPEHIIRKQLEWPQTEPSQFSPGPEPFDSGTSLAAYWQILLRRRWSVVGVLITVMVLVAIASFKMKPVYKATARIEVESDSPQNQMLNENAAYQQEVTDQDFLRTQIQILQTDNLAWHTIEQLGLSQNAALIAADSKQPVDQDARKMQLIRAFKKQLNVELVPGSRVIMVSFESTDPHLASRVANALVENYTDYNFRQSYDATRRAAGRMEQQLDELKAKVEKSQGDLVDYERQHAIVNVGDKENVVEQRLSQLSTDLTQAQNDRIEKEAAYNQIKSTPDKVPSSAQNDLLQKLQEKYAELRGQYVEALDQYGPNYPKVITLQQQVAEAESQVKAERLSRVGKIRNDYTAAKSREALLVQAVARQKEELGNFNRLLVEHNMLKGDYDTNQQLYQRLMQRLKDATVSAGLRSTNIHMVDSALTPTIPVRPNKPLNLAVGFLLGTIFGATLAFVQEALDNSLRSPEDVESLIATSALAIIPVGAQSRAERLLLTNGKGHPERNGNGLARLPVVHSSSSGLSEAYRALRTSVLLSMATRAPQSVLLTSAVSDEGKSSTAINLALALAQCGGPVVLLDCDLRKPSIARVLDLNDTYGMSTYLSGNSTLEDVLQEYPHLPNLSVITSGPVPPNPAELLFSDLMNRLLRDLRSDFKHIIVDSPPLLAVTDATILSTLVDGVVLVVASGVTSKKFVTRARRILDGANAHLLGVALNKVQIRYDGYYGRYYGSAAVD